MRHTRSSRYIGAYVSVDAVYPGVKVDEKTLVQFLSTINRNETIMLGELFKTGTQLTQMNGLGCLLWGVFVLIGGIAGGRGPSISSRARPCWRSASKRDVGALGFVAQRHRPDFTRPNSRSIFMPWLRSEQDVWSVSISILLPHRTNTVR